MSGGGGGWGSGGSRGGWVGGLGFFDSREKLHRWMDV